MIMKRMSEMDVAIVDNGKNNKERHLIPQGSRTLNVKYIIAISVK